MGQPVGYILGIQASASYFGKRHCLSTRTIGLGHANPTRGRHGGWTKVGWRQVQTSAYESLTKLITASVIIP